jgi:hypothetical protein
MADTQRYENHTRIIPAYHMFTFGLVAIYALWSIYRAVVAFSIDTVMALLAAVALVMIFFFARIFALTVQDRLIRLEMRLRMAGLLPADLQSRIPEFTRDQMCALRFASDAELPNLARKVLADGVKDRKTIKKMITNWQGDYLRA